MQSKLRVKLWENDKITEEEADEVQKRAELFKKKMVRTSERIKEWVSRLGSTGLSKNELPASQYKCVTQGSWGALIR